MAGLIAGHQLQPPATATYKSYTAKLQMKVTDESYMGKLQMKVMEGKTMKTTITHGTCGIEMTHHTDYIEVRNADGACLGNIFSADPVEDWEKITRGACPICDGWEDGNGHACTVDGWPAATPEGGK